MLRQYFPRGTRRTPGDDYLIARAARHAAALLSGDEHLLELAGRVPVYSPRDLPGPRPDGTNAGSGDRHGDGPRGATPRQLVLHPGPAFGRNPAQSALQTLNARDLQALSRRAREDSNL